MPRRHNDHLGGLQNDLLVIFSHKSFRTNLHSCHVTRFIQDMQVKVRRDPENRSVQVVIVIFSSRHFQLISCIRDKQDFYTWQKGSVNFVTERGEIKKEFLIMPPCTEVVSSNVGNSAANKTPKPVWVFLTAVPMLL